MRYVIKRHDSIELTRLKKTTHLLNYFIARSIFVSRLLNSQGWGMCSCTNCRDLFRRITETNCIGLCKCKCKTLWSSRSSDIENFTLKLIKLLLHNDVLHCIHVKFLCAFLLSSSTPFPIWKKGDDDGLCESESRKVE